MIINVSGYGATGASAVIALIMECKDIKSYNYGTEFQVLQEPDGILDLQHYIVEDQRRLSSNFAIQRFKNNIKKFGGRDLQKETSPFFKNISKDYIESLISVEWMGKSGFDTADVSGFLYRDCFKCVNKIVSYIGRKINPLFIWPPCYKKYYSYMNNEQFIGLTKKYLEHILKLSGFDLLDMILLEQVFPPNDPTRGMEFFSDCISIVVDRDPRDLYILTNHLMRHKSLFMPCNGDIDGFIKYYKGLHQRIETDHRVKYVQYEDFVYDYENSKQNLLDWIGITMEKERTLFIPEDSINNTFLFPNYPELSDEIHKIESELSQYLYPFEEKGKGKTINRDISKAFIIKPGDIITNKRK